MHVSESPVKPVHSRGKSLDHAFIRSGGTTRAASRQEIGTLMLNSRTPRWEALRATVLQTDAELLARLDVVPILAMLDRPVPSTQDELLTWMAATRFVTCDATTGGYITNID